MLNNSTVQAFTTQTHLKHPWNVTHMSEMNLYVTITITYWNIVVLKNLLLFYVLIIKYTYKPTINSFPQET